MSGHTPGPWEIAPHSDEDEVLQIVGEYEAIPGFGESANWIAECDLQEDIETNAANARLIAAAPDLLEALHDCVGRLRYLQTQVFGNPNFTDRHDDEGACRSVADRADAVIAKAEGRGLR